MTDADAALQRAMADACLGRGSDERIARDLRAFLESHGVEPEDVEALLAAPDRLRVYRALIRNGLGAVVARMLPRTRARIDAAEPGRFERDLAAFVDEPGPRTHYLRDVPGELLAWASPRWRADPRIPPYVADLAAYELAQFEIAASEPARGQGAPADVALDRPLAFDASMRLLRAAWAVHELSGTENATDSPPARDVRLLGYRDAEHAVQWLELTPLAGDVVAALAEGLPLGDAVQRACAAHRTAPAAVLDDVARLLADLGARGVLLGARSGAG
jgi:hypothetical protein